MDDVQVSFDEECFFITPIGKDDSPDRKRADGVLDAVIKPAATQLGLRPVRADMITEGGHVTLQVLEHCANAKVAIADLTSGNLNVYYEVGIRHALRLPVVLIADEAEQLPFDLFQQRTIFYSNDFGGAARCLRSVVEQLTKALEGHVDSPVQAAATLRSLESGDEVQRTLADLVTKVDELASTVAPQTRRILSSRTAGPMWRAFKSVSEQATIDKDPAVVSALQEFAGPMERLLRDAAAPSGVRRELGDIILGLNGGSEAEDEPSEGEELGGES